MAIFNVPTSLIILVPDTFNCLTLCSFKFVIHADLNDLYKRMLVHCTFRTDSRCEKYNLFCPELSLDTKTAMIHYRSLQMNTLRLKARLCDHSGQVDIKY